MHGPPSYQLGLEPGLGCEVENISPSTIPFRIWIWDFGLVFLDLGLGIGFDNIQKYFWSPASSYLESNEVSWTQSPWVSHWEAGLDTGTPDTILDTENVARTSSPQLQPDPISHLITCILAITFPHFQLSCIVPPTLQPLLSIYGMHPRTNKYIALDC